MSAEYQNHNFTKEQLKGILKALTEQLGRMEREGESSKEIRAKMLDISHYDSMFYNMVNWDEYVEFYEELGQIR